MSELQDYPTNDYSKSYNTPLAEATTPFSNNKSNIGANETYKTPKQYWLIAVFLIGFIIGGGILSLFIFLTISGKVEDKSFYYFGYPFIIIWMFGWICGGGCFEFYTSIHINSFLRQITIKRIKLFFCLNKKKVIEFHNINKIIIKKDSVASIDNDDNPIQREIFKIMILLTNNQVFIATSDISDHNLESRKAFDILRNSLPSNIQIETV